MNETLVISYSFQKTHRINSESFFRYFIRNSSAQELNPVRLLVLRIYILLALVEGEIPSEEELTDPKVRSQLAHETSIKFIKFSLKFFIDTGQEPDISLTKEWEFFVYYPHLVEAFESCGEKDYTKCPAFKGLNILLTLEIYFKEPISFHDLFKSTVISSIVKNHTLKNIKEMEIHLEFLEDISKIPDNKSHNNCYRFLLFW